MSTENTTKAIRRAIISGGGTGGHVFPALSIADALRRRFPSVEILFIGAEGRMEMTRIPEAGYEIIGLPVEGLQRRKLWRNFTVIKNYLLSLVKARDIIRSFAPDVVVGVGGYASAPTLKAAQSLGIPTLIQEQNSYAGLTNKMLARRAACICVAYPDMGRFFPEHKIVLTGNPIRPQIEYMQVDRAQALSYFGFPTETERVLLVVGGSLGARTINESVATCLEDLQRAGITLIWQTGSSYAAEAEKALAGYAGRVYCVPFIQRMDYAYAVSDIVISRAGASSISELCLLGKASILVPSPNVAEDHQTKNALALVKRSAALLVADKDAPAELIPRALALMDTPERRASLSTAIKTLALGEAADKIVDELLRITP